jgi:pyrimidine-nucleoside phosphorylase/thymidine phosphorylase
MVESGQRYEWSAIPGVKLDKHSTGGVGDKVSLVLAPLLAACGAIVPMMSGRGLGHTGGTLDKLEAIPGFRVVLTEVELRRQLGTIGVALIGQSAEVAPADRKLYALRDVTATVESIPLITASILSKKIAEGISHLLMDVKVGRGAFMKTVEDARALAESIRSVGELNGLTVLTMLTEMDQPLGNTIGNALEVHEALDTLRGGGPADFRELCVEQASTLLLAAGVCPDRAAAKRLVSGKLTDGSALLKFEQLVAAQGGDARCLAEPSRLPRAECQSVVTATSSGYLDELDAYELGLAAMALGAGRTTAEQAIDPAVGLVVHKKLGQHVIAGEPLITIHHRSGQDISAVQTRLAAAIDYDPDPLMLPPLIYETHP